MRKCNVCGKRAEGLGTYPTEFGSIVMCSNCYEGMKAFQNGRKMRSIDEWETKHQEASEEMRTRAFPQEVQEQVEAWFQAQKEAFEQKERAKAVLANLDSYMMTTGYTFEGYKITAYHGVISGESVLGTGFLSSWNASISDMLGAESSAFIDKLKEARQLAKQRVAQASAAAGGNAIIGIDIEYTMFTNDMIGVIITGTSVTIEKR